jgi:hypothetical protein
MATASGAGSFDFRRVEEQDGRGRNVRHLLAEWLGRAFSPVGRVLLGDLRLGEQRADFVGYTTSTRRDQLQRDHFARVSRVFGRVVVARRVGADALAAIDADDRFAVPSFGRDSVVPALSR